MDNKEEEEATVYFSNFSPKTTTTTTPSLSTTSPTRDNKKKQNCKASDKLSMQNKSQWVVEPTTPILLKFIIELIVVCK